MSKQKSDQQFENEIKLELDRSCDRLDAHTLSRLNQIRHQALEETKGGSSSAFYQRPLLSGGVLAFCTLVLAISFYFNIDTSNEIDIALTELEDIEILSSEESFELYEDIEFYQWLSMNNEF